MWREKTKAILDQHMSADAADATLHLLETFHTVERVTKGETGRAMQESVMRMFLTLTYGLGANRWWQANGHRVMPVFATAVNAWLDASVYANEVDLDEPITTARVVMARSVILEVASAALLADVGLSETRKRSRTMRDALADVEA